MTKNNTNEASMLLKTHDAFRKRTQNELKTSAQVREIESKLELFDSAHVRAADWTVEDVAGFEIARMGETRRIANKYKNSGNEAKNYLKTKDITF